MASSRVRTFRAQHRTAIASGIKRSHEVRSWNIRRVHNCLQRLGVLRIHTGPGGRLFSVRILKYPGSCSIHKCLALCLWDQTWGEGYTQSSEAPTLPFC